jgi:hypothetical protein
MGTPLSWKIDLSSGRPVQARSSGASVCLPAIRANPSFVPKVDIYSGGGRLWSEW